MARTIRQYVIVVSKNVIIRPFYSKKEAIEWAQIFAGVDPSEPHFIDEVKHIDISSRFNLKY